MPNVMNARLASVVLIVRDVRCVSIVCTAQIAMGVRDASRVSIVRIA